MSLSGPNLSRVLWDVRGYNNCPENSLKYERVVKDIVVSTSTYGGLVTDYSTNICPNYYYYSTYIERTSAYGVNVTSLSTEIHSYNRVSTSLDPMGDSNFSTKYHFQYTESTSYYGGNISICCKKIFHSSRFHAGCLKLSCSTYTYTNDGVQPNMSAFYTHALI